MDNHSNEDLEIGDVEGYGTNKDSGFSHQGLVMTSLRRALENGSKEMKPGWIQNKIDRNGNSIRMYIEDTRKAFIESVESCLDVMECDLDDEARTDIDKMVKDLEVLKINLNKKENDEWINLPRMMKLELSKQGKGNMPGYFNREKVYYQVYLEESVKVYRKILRALSKLTQRLDFYKAEIIEG